MYDDSILRETARQARKSLRQTEITLNIFMGLAVVTVLVVLGYIVSKF